MNIHLLKTFIAVAKHNNFSLAAEELYVSQPAISMQIQTLEEYYNCTLIERKSKRVALTPAGIVLKEYAERIIKLCAETEKEIDRTLNQVRGILRIGASMTIGGHYLPRFFAKFNIKHPDVKLRMFVNNTEQVLKGVQKNDFDLGLVEGEMGNFVLQNQVFDEDEMVVVVPRGHSLYNSKEIIIKLNDFIQLPLILREKGSGTRNVLETVVLKSGLPLEALNVVMELGSTESIKGAIKEGIGISVLSRWTIKDEVINNIFREFYLDNIKIRRTFKLVLPHKSFKSLALETLIDELFVHSNYKRTQNVKEKDELCIGE